MIIVWFVSGYHKIQKVKNESNPINFQRHDNKSTFSNVLPTPAAFGALALEAVSSIPGGSWEALRLRDELRIQEG